MEREPKKYLFDILEACKLIVQFSHNKTFEQYQNDPLLRSAIERQFQIVGEGLQQLSRHFPNIAGQISNYKNIIDFRHLLVHGYDQIESDIVWGIVENDLPTLWHEVEGLLNSL